MCDTLGFIGTDFAVFGKNSDRSPNEPQVVEYIPAAEHSEETVQTSYIPVKQVSHTRGILISRPTWLWGAEIGVNDCGVAIGNEAVWTLGKYGKTGLTGMDLLRLALERSDSAKQALQVIISLLEEYGQGGNCGYDHSFYYDNSFLITDCRSLYVLETAGRKWVWKQYPRASISNRLSIGKDGDGYSGGKPYDFALRHTEHLYNIASGSASRVNQTACGLKTAKSAEDVMKILRTHQAGAAPFTKGALGSPCMHYGGPVGDHTTSSMVIELYPEKTVVWATGCSCPCVSLYKPWVFGDAENEMMTQGKAYWYKQEKFRRELLGKEIPEKYCADLETLQQKWLCGSYENCFAEEQRLQERWRKLPFKEATPGNAFLKRWQAKTQIMEQESEV